MKVIVVKEDGYIGVEEVYNDFKDIGRVIGTDCVEVVTPAISIEAGVLPEDVRILCDEEACFKDNRCNSIATVLYTGGIGLRDFIVGTIVLCRYDNRFGIQPLPNEYIVSISNTLMGIKEKLEDKNLLIIDRTKSY